MKQFGGFHPVRMEKLEREQVRVKNPY